ncbi:GGDEF domain-containing protein [Flavobacterium sp. W21_SRS_FM6]|uniref:GGDEF domain-containing protein n=1 Tax=Flavobacterium sp. W21_SRS_FM6 TaxID=3240268 RepID=UPI003F922E94
MTQFQGRLSKKLVIYIMLFSGVFTLAATSYTVYFDYQNRMFAFKQQVEDLLKSYESPLGIAIHLSQNEIVNSISMAFRVLSDEYGVLIRDESGNKIIESYSSDGIFDVKNNPETREQYLIYSKPLYVDITFLGINEEILKKIEGKKGSIELIVGTGQIKQDVLINIKAILLTQAIKAFIVSLFILFLVNKLVLNRQRKIINWLRDFSHNQQVKELEQRDTNFFDELDDMVSTVNHMGKQIVSHQKILESTVNDRTRELVIKNTELEITQKELHLLLHSKSSALSHIEETLSTWLWETDIFGNITTMSDYLSENAKPKTTERNVIRLSDLVELPSSSNQTSGDKVIKSIFDSREPFTIHDAEIRKSSGEAISIRIDGRPKIINDQYQGYNGTITDISSEKRLNKLAYSDGLTGLANRVALENYYESTNQRSSRLGFSIGLMALDLDFFKSINDNFGHAVGDEVLKAVANTLTECIRDEDCVARIGGEEFVVIVQGATADGLITLAKRINDSVASLKIPTLPLQKQVTVSIGFTLLNIEDSLQSGLERADTYLYKAKNNGRNRFATDIA